MQSSSLPPFELCALDPVALGITLFITSMSWVFSASFAFMSKFKSFMNKNSGKYKEVTHTSTSNTTASTCLRGPPEPDDTKQKPEAEHATLLKWLDKCPPLVATNETISPTDAFESQWRALSRKAVGSDDGNHRNGQDADDDNNNVEDHIKIEAVDEDKKDQPVGNDVKVSRNQGDKDNTGQAGLQRVEADEEHNKGDTGDETELDQSWTTRDLLNAHSAPHIDDDSTFSNTASPTKDRGIATDEIAGALSSKPALSHAPKLSLIIPPSPASLADSPHSTLSPSWLSSMTFDFMLSTTATTATNAPNDYRLGLRENCAHLAELQDNYRDHKITFTAAIKLISSLRTTIEAIEEARAQVDVGNEVVEQLESATVLARRAAEREMEEIEKICQAAEGMKWGHAIRCIPCYRKIEGLVGDLRERKREL